MPEIAELPIFEPIPLLPIYATGVGPVNVRRGLVFMSLTSEQCRLDGEGLQRVLAVRLIMPVDLLRETSTKVSSAVEAVLGAQAREAN